MNEDHRTVYDLLTEWQQLDEGHTLADGRRDARKKAYQFSNILRDKVWNKVSDYRERYGYPKMPTDELLGSRKYPGGNRVLQLVQTYAYDHVATIINTLNRDFDDFYDAVFAPRGITNLVDLIKAAPTVRGLNIPASLKRFNVLNAIPNSPLSHVYDRWLKIAWDAKLRRTLMKGDRTAFNKVWNAFAEERVDELIEWAQEYGSFLEQAAEALAQSKKMALNTAPDRMAVGRFTLVNEATAWDFDLALIADALKNAARAITKVGFGAACYGPVVVAPEIRVQREFSRDTDSVYAQYDIREDYVSISFREAKIAREGLNTWLRKYRKLLTRNLTHELAHRVWFKLLTITQRNLYSALAGKLNNILRKEIIKLRRTAMREEEINRRINSQFSAAFVSGYASRSDLEDFAEALAVYATEPSRRREPGVERLYLAGIVRS